jgi:excisionase family DNA binding protein
MMSVREAATLIQRTPETIRRWIRSGRLPSRQVGTRYVIDERDLLALMQRDTLPLPASWQMTATGEPMPNVVRWLSRSRREH